MDPMTAYVHVVVRRSSDLAHSALPAAPIKAGRVAPRSKPNAARQAVSTALLRASHAVAPA